MPNTKARVVGSGFTTFNYRGQPVAFLDHVHDSGQRPIVDPEAVTPLENKFPAEIATCRALGIGTLTVTIRELWDAPVWHQLAGLEGTNSIVDVYAALALEPSEVTCQMIIKIPGSPTWRGKTYHGCVVTFVDDSEEVTIGSLTIGRTMNIAYTNTLPFAIAAPG